MKYGTLRGGFPLLAFAFFSAFTITTASAQTPANSWLAWQGCWRADGAPAGELLCIVPDGAGVRMITLENNTVRAESRVIADNRPRPIKQDGCTGSEVARWSADHRRVFLISQLTCEQNVARQVSGLFAITGPGDWVSAQAVTIEGRTATRSVLYLAVEPTNLPPAIASAIRADRAAVQAARAAALAEVTEAEITEATTNIEPSAVQEWLNATGQPYQIAGAETTTPTTMSALDLVGRAANGVYQDEVVEEVVERPVTYVNTTYVNVVRSCWDPFYAGYVIGGPFGVSYGRSLCGGHYYSRYSPWGYDLFGWHWISRPIVIVRGGPTIIRTSPVHIRRGGTVRRDWDDRRGWDDRRNGDERRDFDGARATRDGYTRDNTRDNRFQNDGTRSTTGRPTGVRTRENTDDRSRSIPPRTTSTRTISSTRSQASTRNEAVSVSRGTRNESTTSSRTARSTSSARPAGYSSRSSSSSGRTAQPRSSSNR
jgi:hypothetical protein